MLCHCVTVTSRFILWVLGLVEWWKAIICVSNYRFLLCYADPRGTKQWTLKTQALMPPFLPESLSLIPQWITITTMTLWPLCIILPVTYIWQGTLEMKQVNKSQNLGCFLRRKRLLILIIFHKETFYKSAPLWMINEKNQSSLYHIIPAWNVDLYLELCVAVKRHPYRYLIPLTIIHVIMFITGISGNVLGKHFLSSH